MGSTYDYTREITETTTPVGYFTASYAMILLALILTIAFVSLMVLLFRALRKYLRSSDVRSEKAAAKISLGEAIKENRTRCKMTQEFVSEHLGVSRQAVSKWENGTSDPSTSNLIAIAKLFEISAEELLKAVENTKNE